MVMAPVKSVKLSFGKTNYQRKTHARINGQLEFGFHRSPPATNNFIYISTPKLACRLQPGQNRRTQTHQRLRLIIMRSTVLLVRACVAVVKNWQRRVEWRVQNILLAATLLLVLIPSTTSDEISITGKHRVLGHVSQGYSHHLLHSSVVLQTSRYRRLSLSQKGREKGEQCFTPHSLPHYTCC